MHGEAKKFIQLSFVKIKSIWRWNYWQWTAT